MSHLILGNFSVLVMRKILDSLQIQSNLDYPDFSIIRTFSLVPIWLWLFIRPWLHETGTNSDRFDFGSVFIQMLVSVYIRPVWKTISCRFHSFQLLNRHEWLGPVWSRTTEPCKHELNQIWDQSKITALSIRMSVVRPFQDGGKQERV